MVAVLRAGAATAAPGHGSSTGGERDNASAALASRERSMASPPSPPSPGGTVVPLLQQIAAESLVEETLVQLQASDIVRLLKNVKKLEGVLSSVSHDDLPTFLAALPIVYR